MFWVEAACQDWGTHGSLYMLCVGRDADRGDPWSPLYSAIFGAGNGSYPRRCYIEFDDRRWIFRYNDCPVSVGRDLPADRLSWQRSLAIVSPPQLSGRTDGAGLRRTSAPARPFADSSFALTGGAIPNDADSRHGVLARSLISKPRIYLTKSPRWCASLVICGSWNSSRCLQSIRITSMPPVQIGAQP
jgi:hypothetical protein